MKLNLTPKELLVLYNLLYTQQTEQIRFKYEPGTNPIPDHVYLDQVFGRVKSLIIVSIGRQSDDPADAKKVRVEEVLAHEQSKIDGLQAELVSIAKQPTRLTDDASKLDPDFLIPHRDEDLVVPEYPTRMRPRQGGHHGRKK